jgi:NAD(P)-dependent dehydrogenase (short-subunit alcohol dehydrogenase family)
MSDQPIALVTGAAQGIGYASAEAIAEGGARVVLADINEAGVTAAAETLGGDAVAMRCDMADPAQINALFDRIEKELGTVSILVNCAGIAAPGEFLEISLEQFQSVIDVNLTGTFVATQRAAKAMIAAGIQGAIVNMSSVNAVGPGSIDTAMMAGVNANPQAMDMVMSRTPLKRIGRPREIGDIVAFLASDKASYITGETIYADGGRLGMNYTC